MYIKLIQPKMKKRPMDTDIKIHMAPPLGLLTIVNLVRENHRVSLENENIQKINYKDKPDIVGISITVDTIKDYENRTLKPIYKCNKAFRGDDIVSPAYDFLEKDKYLYCNVIHTSRGCPFRCDFCYNSGKEHMFVNRKIEDVLQDIKAVHSKHIMFIDDNFVGNPGWTREFLSKLKPLKLKWNAAVSINALFDEELLDQMKDSGCRRAKTKELPICCLICCTASMGNFRILFVKSLPIKESVFWQRSYPGICNRNLYPSA